MLIQMWKILNGCSRLWNTIPAHLHQFTELATFKMALTKYLLTILDTPPDVGYVGVNSNSLLD